MFIVEGGLSFDTRKGIAGARAFQNELKRTSKVAEQAGLSGKNLETNFSGFASQRTRTAIKGLASSLANAKDATEATADAARALQTAFVKSLTGTALIAGAGALANIIRDVGSRVGGAADESARAMNAFKGFASSLEEGRQRSNAFAQSADNTLKALEGIKNAGIFQAGVFRLFGGDKILKDLQEATKGVAQAEFAGGAAAERKIAEERIGMSPEQIAADKRKREEQKRLREARESGGPRAEADVARTIAAENEQERILKGRAANELFAKDVLENEAKIAQARQSSDDKKKQAQLDQLTASARLIELDKEAKALAEKIASIQRRGIFGTEQARKKQLQELLKLEERSLEIADQKEKALAEQKQDQAEDAKREAEDKARELNNELEQIKRQRESLRKQAENREQIRKIESERQASRNVLNAEIGGGILGASQAGRQALDVARKQRQTKVSREDFQTQNTALQAEADRLSAIEGKVLTKEDVRKRIAAQQAAGENPSLREKVAGGLEGVSPEQLARSGSVSDSGKGGKGIPDLVSAIEKLIQQYSSAPLVTGGSGKN